MLTFRIPLILFDWIDTLCVGLCAHIRYGKLLSVFLVGFGIIGWVIGQMRSLFPPEIDHFDGFLREWVFEIISSSDFYSDRLLHFCCLLLDRMAWIQGLHPLFVLGFAKKLILFRSYSLHFIFIFVRCIHRFITNF